MQNLKHYIDNRNSWNSFFPGSTAITFPLTQAEVNSIAGSLDSDLSPENLHCDGEASLTHVRAKAKQLNLVSKQLEQYCLDNWLDTPVLEY